MGFLKKLFKRNWQVLTAIGFNYVKKNLLPRIQLANPFFATIMHKAVDMGEEAIGLLTDNEKDDKAQMKQLLKDHYEELVMLATVGAVNEINDDEARIRVIAILKNTCEELESKLDNPALATTE